MNSRYLACITFQNIQNLSVWINALNVIQPCKPYNSSCKTIDNLFFWMWLQERNNKVDRMYTKISTKELSVIGGKLELSLHPLQDLLKQFTEECILLQPQTSLKEEEKRTKEKTNSHRIPSWWGTCVV